MRTETEAKTRRVRFRTLLPQQGVMMVFERGELLGLVQGKVEAEAGTVLEVLHVRVRRLVSRDDAPAQRRRHVRPDQPQRRALHDLCVAKRIRRDTSEGRA